MSEHANRFDAVVFAGGGCRCFWQAGFWDVAAGALELRPRVVGAVSAGAAFACAAFAGRLERVVEDFKRRAAENARNVYPRNLFTEHPVFPHERLYRAALLASLDDSILDRLHTGPDIRVFLARPPGWLGARSGVAVGFLAYEMQKLSRGGVHPSWARRLGFRGELVSVRSCQTSHALADLVLHSSCTPPMTPLYRRDGRVVLDGGLVDNVPMESVGDARSTLVLLSRRYEDEQIPRVPGRTYVQPSRSMPIEKWDYTSPGKIQETWDLGRRDGEAFVRAIGSGEAPAGADRAGSR